MQAWWQVSIIPLIWEAEGGGFLEAQGVYCPSRRHSKTLVFKNKQTKTSQQLGVDKLTGKKSNNTVQIGYCVQMKEK